MSPQVKLRIDDWTKWLTRVALIGAATIITNSFIGMRADVDILLQQQTGWQEWRIGHERRTDTEEVNIQNLSNRLTKVEGCCNEP